MKASHLCRRLSAQVRVPVKSGGSDLKLFVFVTYRLKVVKIFQTYS